MRVPFSFLTEQFENSEPIFDKIKEFLKRCDFTLGEDLSEFESRYASYIGVKHAIGVGTGTDALFLSLKAAGVEPGDEVIVPTNTFIAIVIRYISETESTCCCNTMVSFFAPAFTCNRTKSGT